MNGYSMFTSLRSSIVRMGAFLVALLAGCGVQQLQDVRSYEQCTARNLGKEVNSASDDYAASPNGSRLFLTSNRPTIEGYIQGDDIWFTDAEVGNRSEALNFGGTINTVRDEGATYFVPGGSTVFFTQCWTEDGAGDGDIYTASIDAAGKWQSLRNLGEPLNTKYWESHATLSPDGEELYFSSDRPGGMGGADIWVSKRLRNGKWGPPKNLGAPVNTSSDEKAPFMYLDGDSLFFAGNGHPGLGGYDIFVSVRDGKKGWKTPVNIGRPFNSSSDDMFFRVSAEEDTVFISSRRPEGLGGFDVYAVVPNPFRNPERYTFYLALTVRDSVRSRNVPDAKIVLESQGEAPQTVLSDSQGKHRRRTSPGKRYKINVSAQGYEENSRSVAVPSSMYSREHAVRVYLDPIAQETPPVAEETRPDVPTVLFEFDRSDILPDFAAELDALYGDMLAKLVQGKLEFEVQLDAHTDDTGSEEYNIGLSRRRGAAVSRYLTRKGVPRSSIVMNAYGKSRPAVSNETDDGRRLNRRVEIRIISGGPPQ